MEAGMLKRLDAIAGAALAMALFLIVFNIGLTDKSFWEQMYLVLFATTMLYGVFLLLAKHEQEAGSKVLATLVTGAGILFAFSFALVAPGPEDSEALIALRATQCFLPAAGALALFMSTFHWRPWKSFLAGVAWLNLALGLVGAVAVLHFNLTSPVPPSDARDVIALTIITAALVGPPGYLAWRTKR